MKDAWESFSANVTEVNVYFRLLRALDRQKAGISAPNLPSHLASVTMETRQIVKAGAYLILYNFVESTVRACLTAVFDAVKEEQLNYQELASTLKTLWIRQRFRELDSGNAGLDSYRKAAKLILEQLLSNDEIDLDSKFLPVSGTLDARLVRDVAQCVGFSVTHNRVSNAGADLLSIKTQRNYLAHGERSFSSCGGAVAAEDLVRLKRATIIYLRSFMADTEQFITTRQYVK